MDKTINKRNKYLNFKGLESYDKLIKSYIAYSNKTLKKSIDDIESKIEDLDTIRSGAALGSTALQSVPDEYITETELSEKIVKKNDIDNIFQIIK